MAARGERRGLLHRLPIESTQPVVVFAFARLALLVLALPAIVVLGFPYEGRAFAVLGAAGLPWALAVLVLAQRTPDRALSPAVAVGDIAVLMLLELVAPELYGPVRFVGLFLFSAHAHFQGERRGPAVAALGALALIIATAIRGDAPASGGLLAVYETVFALAALATGLILGRLRTTESASRLRARDLSRRTLQSEREARRRVAQSIHDGPVQELIGLDMVLSAAAHATESGEAGRATALIEEARELAERNVRALRDEIVDLGPYAFEELGFGTAIENCMPIWRRRFGFEVMASLERVQLSPEVAGELFRIAQEAVVNAGRHAKADAVSISLRRLGRDVELRVADDGDGFAGRDPLAPGEPGHLGLASMRERAELLEGTLQIVTSARGTKVVVRAPLARVGG
jgi:signal transduction histidine kinase